MTVRSKKIRTYSKDSDLVKKRRLQIAEAGYRVFSKYGYHKASMRQIVEASGLGIGSIYHYVISKPDILYLASEYAVEAALDVVNKKYDISNPEQALREAIKETYRSLNKRKNMVLFAYQELKHLPPDMRKPILENDRQFAKLFEKILIAGMKKNVFRKDLNPVLVSQDIVVLGHMWSFRSWALSKNIDFEVYLHSQMEFILRGCIEKTN